MSKEEAIKYFELCLKENAVEREDITPLRVLINAVKNSVSKDEIRKINENTDNRYDFTEEILKLLEE